MNQMPMNLQQLQMQQSYTDLNQLNAIRQAGKEDQSVALKEVAKQFEAMFLSMMLKSMRQANDVFGQDNPLNSSESQFHRDMFDQQLTLTLSQGNGTGLAEAFYRQMSSSYLNNTRAEAGEMTDPVREDIANPYAEKSVTPNQHRVDSEILNNLSTPDDFIAAITPYAKQASAEMGVDYRVLVAQSALETGWGQSATKDRYGAHSLNLFNIKADSRWDGHHVKVPTLEYVNGVAVKENAQFRRYQSIADSFSDYQDFLKQPRYEQAMAVSDDSSAYLDELQRAGYATDPNYANKIQQILRDYETSFDG